MKRERGREREREPEAKWESMKNKEIETQRTIEEKPPQEAYSLSPAVSSPPLPRLRSDRRIGGLITEHS